MNAVTRFVHVVFGSYPRNRDGLSAPGDADCRWRVVMPAPRQQDAMEFDVTSSDGRSVEPDVDVRRE